MAEQDLSILEAENRRLRKMVEVLMNRAERSTEVQGSDFTLFQTAIMLEDQVRARTTELEHALAEQDRVREALRKSDARFEAIFELSPSPVALTRLSDGLVLGASRSFKALFSLGHESPEDHLTAPGDLNIWLRAEDRLRWREQLQADGQAFNFETELRTAQGQVVSVLLSGKVVDFGDEPHVIADIRDISEHKRRSAYLEHAAAHDPLTGLPNRLLLGTQLSAAIARAERNSTVVAVCYLDLDGFKQINDRFGHDEGDSMLVEVARRLENATRHGDTVARLGGDEFVLVLADLHHADECAALLQRLLQNLALPVGGKRCVECSVSASVGVALYPNDDSDPDALIRHADHAMYEAKQAGKNRCHWFASRSGP